MIRATNTGATVDHRPSRPGDAFAAAPHARRAGRRGGGRAAAITPYAWWVSRLGLWPLWLLALVAIVGLRGVARAGRSPKMRRFRGPPTRTVKSAVCPRAPPDADLPANHPEAAVLLGRAGLRAAAALRHGSRRRHLAHRHLPARARPRALEGRLRAAQPPPQGRPLRREPEPPAALLPVPGGAQAGAGQHPGAVPRLARGAGLRPEEERHPLRRGRLGEPHAGRLGPGLGGLAQRHGGHAVHLLPAGRRHRLQADHRRDHLRPGAPGDVPAGRGQRLRPEVDRRPDATATSTSRTRSSSRPTTSSTATPSSCSPPSARTRSRPST